PPDKRHRQATYLEALSTLSPLRVFEGHFLATAVQCLSCHASWTSHEEKMTDVQIATELLSDAFQDRFDTALIVSADSDLVPPIRAIRALFPGKSIVAAFPPKRYSRALETAAHAHFTLGRAKLAHSQFPDQVTKPDGHVLDRPPTWK